MPIFVQLIQPDRMGLICKDDGDELLTDLKQLLEESGDGFVRLVIQDGGQSMLIPTGNIAIVRYISKEDVEKNKKRAEKEKKEAEMRMKEERQSNIITPRYAFPQGKRRLQ